jgi:hypothetical protein
MPSQTQIAFDLNTLYTRYDSSGTNSGAGGSIGVGTGIKYYGYSNPGTQDSTTSFSIKKVYSIGNVEYVDWNNNSIGDYSASWTNRNFYFATPSNINVTGNTSFDGTWYNVTFNWAPGSTGASKYIATFAENGRLLTNLANASDTTYNPYNNTYNVTLINQNSATLNRCRAGYSYSISIYAVNGIGISSTATRNIAL